MGHKQQIACFLSQIERALYHRGRGLDGLSPWQDMVADDTVNLAAKTREILSPHERDQQMANKTSMSARKSASLIDARSTRVSIGRSPTRCRSSSYSARTSSSLG